MELTFGKQNPEIEYRRRPGAYAVIFDGRGKFAAVIGNQKYFLPGGGIDPGESLEETLAREVREECAREVVIGRFLGSAVQYFSTETEHWEFHCSYFEARFGAPLDNEPEHELVWLDVADAGNLLMHEVHGWAICLAAEQARQIETEKAF